MNPSAASQHESCMARELLRQVRVASPCNVAWSEMQGDERVRFCEHCHRNVYNLSEMTVGEAEDLLRQKTGRLCKRFFQRSDGTILTKDCPVGMCAVRRKL